MQKRTFTLSVIALLSCLSLSEQAPVQASQSGYENLTFKELFPRADEMDWVIPYGPTTGQRVLGAIIRAFGLVLCITAGFAYWHLVALLEYMGNENQKKFSTLLDQYRTTPNNPDTSLQSVPWAVIIIASLLGVFFLFSLLNKLLIHEQLRCGKEGMMIPSSALKRSFMQGIGYFFTAPFSHQPFYIKYDEISYIQDVTQAVIVTNQSESGVKQEIKRFGTTLQHTNTQTKQTTVYVRSFVVHNVNPRTNEDKEYVLSEGNFGSTTNFGLMFEKMLRYRGVQKLYKEMR
ncbi:MAG: hypothetical protein AAF335_03570 [Bacteroidota bacterium]